MPKPTPKAGEVLLEVRAVSVNFVDLVMMSGSYQFKPFKTSESERSEALDFRD